MKISINILTYIFYLILILSGYINYLLIYIGILIFHELGHILFLFLFKYKISKINIYPTGSIIETNITININSFHQLIISSGGILFQIILFFIIKDNNTYTYDIFYSINKMLIIFNLIPIYPLDGYKILLSLMESLYKYRIIIFISYIISLVSNLIYFSLSKNIIIFVFLYIINIKNIMNFKYYYQKFLLERYLYKIRHKKNKNVKNTNDFYKNYNNYIIINKSFLNEDNIYKYLYKAIDKN